MIPAGLYSDFDKAAELNRLHISSTLDKVVSLAANGDAHDIVALKRKSFK